MDWTHIVRATTNCTEPFWSLTAATDRLTCTEDGSHYFLAIQSLWWIRVKAAMTAAYLVLTEDGTQMPWNKEMLYSVINVGDPQLM